MTIGDKIRELRLESGLLQKELASKINIAPNTLSQFESGKANPSYEVLIAFADIFACSTDYLLGRSDDFGNITVLENEPTLSSDEKKLLDDYRALNTKNKIHVSAYASIRREEQENIVLKRG